MDDILKAKITAKLTAYLNRAPSDDEIINGQNDANLMHWIAQDDAADQKAQIDAISIATNVDISQVSANTAL